MDTRTGEIKVIGEHETIDENSSMIPVSNREEEFLKNVPQEDRLLTLSWIRFFYGYVVKKYPKIAPLEKEKFKVAFTQGFQSAEYFNKKSKG